MDTNIAAWMIAGGPRLEGLHAERDREQLHAFRESQRLAHVARPSLLDRLRGVRVAGDETDLVCCTA
jgi:hypothetical protein